MKQSSMMKRDSNTGNILVNTGTIRFLMFSGHLFPVRIETAAGGKFPLHEFRDRVEYGNITYRLNEDRFAEFIIQENTAKRLTIVCFGKPLCVNTLPVCSDRNGLISRYSYTVDKNSGTITLHGEISRTDCESAVLHFLDFSWRGTPWKMKNIAIAKCAELETISGLRLKVAGAEFQYTENAPGRWQTRLFTEPLNWCERTFSFDSEITFH